MIVYKKAIDEKHLHQILTLQQHNLPQNLTEKEVQKEGFVTCEHSIDLLSKMNVPYPHIIAIKNEEVIGYALIMEVKMKDSLEVLKPMFNMLEILLPKSGGKLMRSYFVMGQVCVGQTYRGQGVFYGLYEYMKLVMSPHYELCVTEISSFNKRSLKAHANQGFKTFHKYNSPDGHPWEIVSWDWS